MGLLQKATEQNSNSPELRKNNFLQIKNRLQDVKNTLEFHPLIFKEIVDLLSIEKGALLIKEDDIFSLSSIIGYDKTTNNRLRISAAEYQSFLKTGNKNLFQNYFSIREFVTLKKILVIPFTNSNVVQALLLITEFKTEKEPLEVEIKNYIADLEELFVENPLQKLKNPESQSNDIKNSIRTYLQKVKSSENRIIFLKLNLNNLLKEFKDNDTLSTKSSLKNSALKMLTSFSQTRGKVFQLYNNDILLTLLDKKDSTNIVVIQQQINTAFRTVFSNKLGSLDLNFESLIWKNNSLDTILDHFIQNESY